MPRTSCALSRLCQAILWVNVFHMLKNSVCKMREFELGSILRGSHREQELGVWVRPNCFGYLCGRTVTCPPHSPSLLPHSLDFSWGQSPGTKPLFPRFLYSHHDHSAKFWGHWKSEGNFWASLKGRALIRHLPLPSFSRPEHGSSDKLSETL